MSEKKYRVSLSAPLGERTGTMVIKETDGRIEVTLEMMNRSNALFGTLSGDGRIVLSGSIKTLISTVQYTAEGTVSGRRILLNLKRRRAHIIRSSERSLILMTKFYEHIVSHRKLIIAVFLIIFAVCAVCQRFVAVNYDMNYYLPKKSASTQALDLMEKEYGGGNLL